MKLGRTMRSAILCGLAGLWGGCSRDDGREEPSVDGTVSIASAVDAPVVLERVELASPTVAIGGASVAYQAVLANRTPSTVSSLALQNRIEQGMTQRAAGGKLLSCRATQGDIAPGSCTDDWSYHASNGSPGPGTLVAGPATLIIELKRGRSEVLQSLRIPITLQ